jgi:GTP-binding protein
MSAAADTAPLGADAIEAGRKLFAGSCEFVAGSATHDALPQATLPEVAFVGRSNVGKSSLVNALTGRNTLARVSRAPGRTQQLNFFNLADRLILVDLPGYGFARVGKAKMRDWQQLARDYLRGRPTLRRTLVLIDARHGVKPQDEDIFKALTEAAVSFQAVLTKSDLVAPEHLARMVAEVGGAIARHTAAHPDVPATSAETGAGIAELRAALAALARAR